MTPVDGWQRETQSDPRGIEHVQLSYLAGAKASRGLGLAKETGWEEEEEEVPRSGTTSTEM